MATWAAFAEAEPEMAALGLRLLDAIPIAYLATVRADGAPRVHPVCPFFVDGRLILATPVASPKARDLLRDGRYVLHMLPGEGDDAEFRVRGRARPIIDEAGRTAVLVGGPHFLHGDDYFFEYDIEHAATASWVNVGKPGTYALRKSWRAS
jgi:hypothetical protein